MLKLRLEQQLSQFPFVNKQFEVDVYLADDQDHLKSGEEIKLNILVAISGSEDTYVNQSKVLEIVENTGIQKNGAGRIVVKFIDVSSSFDKKRFVLNLQAQHPTLKITGAQSIPMYCVRYKLHVEETEKAPYIWYKDEGGKDKCIEYKVSLRDSNGRTFRDRKVPLKLTLNYVNGATVSHQNILVLSPDSRLVIDENGDGLLKVRIVEVSNRHRGQLFQVEISADTVQSPGAADVAPILCMPVDVKSKRNKSSGQKTPREESHPISYAEPIKKSKVIGGSMQYGVPYQPSTMVQPIAFGSSNGNINSGSSIGNNNGGLGNHTSSLPKRSSHSLGTMSSYNNASQRSLDDSTTNGMGYGTGSSSNMGDCVNNVVSWAVTIMKGIDAIQWRELGYEQNTDGTPNLARPLFSIPNPNVILHEIVEQYSQSVVSSLRYLQQIADSERGQMDGINSSGNMNSSLMNGRNTPIDSDEDDDYPSNGFSRTKSKNGGERLNVNNSNNVMNNSSSTNNSNMSMNNSSNYDAFNIPQPQLERGLSTFSARNVDELFTTLQRERSTLDIPDIKRNNSLFLDGVGNGMTESSGQQNIPVPVLLPSLSTWGIGNVFDITSDNESQVFYVLASSVSVAGGISGLPAYNSSKEMIGMYRELTGKPAGSGIKFTPLSSFNPGVKKFEQDLIKAKLEKYLSLPIVSPRVFMLSKYGNRIEVMKNEVMTYLLEHESDKDE